MAGRAILQLVHDCQALVFDTIAHSTSEQSTDLKQCSAAGHAGGHSPVGLPGELWGVLCWQPAQRHDICWAPSERNSVG